MAVLQITLSWVSSRDHRLMVRVNHWRPPKWLRMWMLAATRGGDGGLWYALGLAVALYGGPQRFHALLAATLAVAAGVALFLELKRPFGGNAPVRSNHTAGRTCCRPINSRSPRATPSRPSR